MDDKMVRALESIGALAKDGSVVIRRPISREDYDSVRNSSVAIHGDHAFGEVHANKPFNSPMQAVAMTASGDTFELGCDHEWKTQGSSIPHRGIYDYKCAKCGATYTYDSSD